MLSLKNRNLFSFFFVLNVFLPFLFFGILTSFVFAEGWIRTKSVAQLCVAVEDAQASSVVFIPFQSLSFESPRVCSIIFERFYRYFKATNKMKVSLSVYDIQNEEGLLEDNLYKGIEDITAQHILSGRVVKEKKKWYLYVYLLDFFTDVRWNLLWQKKIRITPFWAPASSKNVKNDNAEDLELCFDEKKVLFDIDTMKSNFVLKDNNKPITSLKDILFKFIYTFSKYGGVTQYHGRESVLQGLSLWSKPKDMKNYFALLVKARAYSGILHEVAKFCYGVACAKDKLDEKWLKKSIKIMQRLSKSEYIQIRSISHFMLGFLYHSQKKIKIAYKMFQETIVLNPLNNNQVFWAVKKSKEIRPFMK